MTSPYRLEHGWVYITLLFKTLSFPFVLYWSVGTTLDSKLPAVPSYNHAQMSSDQGHQSLINYSHFQYPDRHSSFLDLNLSIDYVAKSFRSFSFRPGSTTGVFYLVSDQEVPLACFILFQTRKYHWCVLSCFRPGRTTGVFYLVSDQDVPLVCFILFLCFILFQARTYHKTHQW